MIGYSITVSDKVFKPKKRVFAFSCFCGTDISRFDNVMVGATKQNSRTFCQSCNETELFAKKSLCLSAHVAERKLPVTLNERGKDLNEFENLRVEELCFVH